MYGKAFESMYSGSMVGAGLNVFAVWNYIITMTRDSVVEVNPKLLSLILGCEEDQVSDALKKLCEPDPRSRSKECGGRKLLKEGEFQYRVVNWEHYQRIRNEADRREYNRVKQAQYRARKKFGPSAREVRYDREVGEGMEPNVLHDKPVPTIDPTAPAWMKRAV